MTTSRRKTTRDRQRAMLRTAMGPVVGAALQDPDVIEVMANPDGRLWIDKHGAGLVDSGEVLSPADSERIIRLVASHIHVECDDRNPVVSAELPETGERFEGLLPPVTAAPAFAIRKPAAKVFLLDDYVAAQVMTAEQARVISQAVLQRRNILVVGGTSSGKTTLCNALLAEIDDADRVVVIEDTRELQCTVPNSVMLRTKAGVASLADLVRSTLRLRPDRIIVGEVRGPEALDLIKSWNTGHPGGVTTIHANSARAGLYRLEQLVQEAVVTVPRRLIAEAIDLIVFITGRGDARRVAQVAEVVGLTDDDYQLALPIGLPPTDKPSERNSNVVAALEAGLR